MNIRRTSIALAAATLTLLAFAAIACSGDDDDPPGDGATAVAATSTPTEAPISYASDAPVTFGVRAGYTQGNIDVEAFLPADIRVRVGDTIEWTSHGYEGHTVTFGDGDDTLAGIGDYLVPDPANPAQVIFTPTLALPSTKQGTHDGTTEFINSGFFGIPLEAKYSLAFTQPGLFTYLCLVHPFTMNGTVSVEPAGTQVESPETIAARQDAEAERYAAELDAEARRLSDGAVTAPGPDGSTIYYVQVGVITDYGQAAVYAPPLVEIERGDTVIFQNDDRNFHNVVFKGSRPELPPGIGISIPPDGVGLNFSLDNASAVAVDPPPEGFDETTFLSSGSMGVTQPRLTWTLKFENPGTYTYACTIHTLAGMVGAVEVR